MACTHLFFCMALFMLLSTGHCRKHQLILENDSRNYFPVSTFGLLEGGKLHVRLYQLSFYSKFNPRLGFTLTKTRSSLLNSFITLPNLCSFNDLLAAENMPTISFLLDLMNNELLMNCSNLFPDLEIKSVTESYLTVDDDFVEPAIYSPKTYTLKQSVDTVQNKGGAESTKRELEIFNQGSDAFKMNDVGSTFVDSVTCSSSKIPFKSQSIGPRTEISDLQLVVSLNGIKDVGMYNLYFHNCPTVNIEGHIEGKLLKSTQVNLSISIIESNGENYLSAGEMPLPKLYFIMSFAFFVAGCVWIAVLLNRRLITCKIHYLMGLLVFVKCISLLSSGVNYKIIEKEGLPVEPLAILHYVTQSLTEALLAITIVLIGAGWSIIKDILSFKDKIVFVIVILMQVLPSVARNIRMECKDAKSCYISSEYFFFFDLICCGALPFPTIWSIKHLQKTAANLEKIKLFKFFFVEIVCYVYFSRIIAYLIKANIPFQYEWLEEVCRETMAFVFFIAAGITFQPTENGPYSDLHKSVSTKSVPLLKADGI